MGIKLSESEQWRGYAPTRSLCRTQVFYQVMSDFTTPTAMNRGMVVMKQAYTIVLNVVQMLYRANTAAAETRTERTQTERTGTTATAGKITAVAATRTKRTQTGRTGITAVAGKGSFEVATRVQKNEHYDAKTAAAEIEPRVQTSRTEGADKQSRGCRQAEPRMQTSRAEGADKQSRGCRQAVKDAEATGIPKMQRMGQGLEGENIEAAAAMKHMERTERLERSCDVEMQEKVASKRSAWMQRDSRTRRPAAMAITTVMLVITILASAEAGMTENAGAQVAGLQSVCMEEAENARTTAHSQTQQVMKSDREQRLEAKEVDELTAKLGELRLTIDKIGELKREECCVKHSETAESQRIRADGAEATLNILDELNNNMRSEIEKQGTRVNLGRHIQFMRRLLDAERHKAQDAQELRQGNSAETESMQQQKREDINDATDQGTAHQVSRRHKMMMRRLQEDARQRHGAEKEIQSIIIQVTAAVKVQEEEEHDAKRQREGEVNAPCELKYNADKRQDSSVKHGNTRNKSGKYADGKSDRDQRRGRNAEISDSGDELRTEHAPAEMRSTEGVAPGADTGTLKGKNGRQQAYVEKEWETGTEGTGSKVTWIDEWIPLIQKYREFVMGWWDRWKGLGYFYMFVVISMGVLYIFVAPSHTKPKVREIIAEFLILGIGIIVLTVLETKVAGGLDTHAQAINIAMRINTQGKIHPDVTKRKFERDENANEYIDTGNSGELKKDGNKVTLGLVDHTAFGVMAEGQTADDENSGAEERSKDAVVKALTAQAPAVAAFAGMHEMERGNGFGLGDHTACGAKAEGATADEKSTGGVDTGEVGDTRPRSPRRSPKIAENILTYLPWLSMAVGLVSITLMTVAELMHHVGDMGTEALYMARRATGMIFAGAGYVGVCSYIMKVIVVSYVVGMPPAAAYSVAGIGH